MLRRKRTWDLIGCILGLSVLVVGLAFLTTPPDAYSTRSADYAVFGADYYTYQYEATQIVAENVATTANNLREIGTAFARYTGVFFHNVWRAYFDSLWKELFCRIRICSEHKI